MLDNILSAFSPHVKHSQDCFKLLCKHLFSLAKQGNVIIIELGGAIVIRNFESSWHFLIYGFIRFKTKKIAQRNNFDLYEAEKYVLEHQRQRDTFNRDFLDQDDHNPLLYDMLFNNDRKNSEQITLSVAEFVTRALS